MDKMLFNLVYLFPILNSLAKFLIVKFNFASGWLIPLQTLTGDTGREGLKKCESRKGERSLSKESV